MTKGKRAGERGPSAPGMSHKLSDALYSAPRKALRGKERNWWTEGDTASAYETILLHLIPLHVKSEMLLNEFYLLFPESKLGVLEKKKSPFLAGDSRRVRGSPFAMYLREY